MNDEKRKNTFNGSLDLLQTVFAKASDMGVCLLNKDYTVLWANKMTVMAVSKTPDEMTGKP